MIFMSHRSHPSHRYAILAIAGLLLTAGGTTAFAQSSDSTESVAQAARRAREQKKTSAKPIRTVTNDNLPAAPPDNSSPSTAAPASSSAPEDATGQAKPEAKTDAAKAASDDKTKEKKAALAAALDRAKKQLGQMQSQLDVLQRKAVLDNESYYSKTDFASDKDGKASLDAEAQQITDKQQAVEDLKSKIADMEAQLGEPATTPPADKDNPPSNPQPDIQRNP
jgi:hypothetical protein